MLKRSVVSVLAALVLAVSLLVIAFLSVLANLVSALRAAIRRMPSRHRHQSRNPQFAREFGFEHAIEAYEELIDATLAERRA